MGQASCAGVGGLDRLLGENPWQKSLRNRQQNFANWSPGPIIELAAFEAARPVESNSTFEGAGVKAPPAWSRFQAMMPALLPHPRFRALRIHLRCWQRSAAPLMLGVAVFALAPVARAQEVTATVSEKPTTSETTDAAPTAEQIRAVLASLDDDSFSARQFAQTRLKGWVASPKAQAPLAEALQALLLDPETSFEVRTICESIAAQLPQQTEQRDGPISPTEIDRLIAFCDADLFSLRAGAAARLAWLSRRDPKMALSVANKIKTRLADPELSSELRVRLTDVWQTARGVWLASDPAGWPPAIVSDAQLEAWITALAAKVVNKQTRVAAESAERELFDLMSRDDQVARVRAALEKRLPNAPVAADLEPVVAGDTPAEVQAEFEAADRLERLYEWTKPAMVAEIWRGHTHDCIQYLEIGVKQYLQGAINPRPTHFDRIDDSLAHCVSGNSLAPGEYPVGIAIPPTSLSPDIPKDGRMFHLINLATPRRRLLYENYQVKRSEDARLAELTERTTAWMLAQKRTLTEREILMFAQLDPVVVSRFVGPYLAANDDAPRTEQPDDYPMIGRNSRHALLCLMLSDFGTHECLPGLTEAIRRGRVPGPNDRSTYHVGWLAALQIADRHPWPGIDDWLASLIEREDVIHAVRATPPDVGATAAAMLLARHGASLSEFGLIEYTDAQLPGMNFPLCRFNAPERRGQVLQWWKQRRQKTPAA